MASSSVQRQADKSWALQFSTVLVSPEGRPWLSTGTPHVLGTLLDVGNLIWAEFGSASDEVLPRWPSPYPQIHKIIHTKRNKLSEIFSS